jgi:hypothetical protein
MPEMEKARIEKRRALRGFALVMTLLLLRGFFVQTPDEERLVPSLVASCCALGMMWELAAARRSVVVAVYFLVAFLAEVVLMLLRGSVYFWPTGLSMCALVLAWMFFPLGADRLRDPVDDYEGSL